MMDPRNHACDKNHLIRGCRRDGQNDESFTQKTQNFKAFVTAYGVKNKVLCL